MTYTRRQKFNITRLENIKFIPRNRNLRIRHFVTQLKIMFYRMNSKRMKNIYWRAYNVCFVLFVSSREINKTLKTQFVFRLLYFVTELIVSFRMALKSPYYQINFLNLHESCRKLIQV